MSKKTTLMICLLVGFTAFACKGPEDEAVVVGSSASSSSGSSVSPGVVNDEIGFKVEVDSTLSTSMLTYTHVSGSTNECVIDSVAAYSSVNCIIEVDELELYFHGLKIAYNVPTNLCEYFAIRPFYFYQYQPGTGNTAVEVEVLSNGTAMLIEPGTHTVNVSAVNVNVGTTAGAGFTAAYTDTTMVSGTPTCNFNYGGEEPAGPNCCEGTYTYIVHTQDSAGNWTSASSVTTEWGGKHSNCAKGPAMETAVGFDRSGYPLTAIYAVSSSGKADSLSMAAPISVPHYSTANIANFINGIFSAGTRLTATNADAGQPLGAAIRATQPFYLFQCLDRAKEVKAQIRVAVREWNTYADFASGASVGPNDLIVTPDTGGVEAGSGEVNNDFEDWDDIEPGTGASGSALPESFL